LWCGSQHYTRGGWPRDHFFDPNYVNRAVGCAVIIRHFHLLGIDTGIKGLGTVMSPQKPVIEESTKLEQELPEKALELEKPKPLGLSWFQRFLRKIKIR
jgi:hypothetical protein